MLNQYVANIIFLQSCCKKLSSQVFSHLHPPNVGMHWKNNYFCVCQKFNPYSAELFVLKPWRLRDFCQFEIIINVLVSSFWFIWIPMLQVYDHYKYFNHLSAGTVFILQNLTSTDVRFWRIKTVPALKGSLTDSRGMHRRPVHDVSLIILFWSRATLPDFILDNFHHTYSTSAKNLNLSQQC